MKNNTRAAVAYIAGRIILEVKVSTVYYHSRTKLINIDGEIDGRKVDVFDYDAGCYISGNYRNRKYDLYHFGENHYIDLKIKGNTFEGYDYEEAKYFSER